MRRFQTPLFTLLLIFVLPLALASCDSGGSGGNGGDDSFSIDQGSFNLTVTEDGEETDFSGGAVFGIGSEASSLGGEAFVIYMLHGEKTLEDDGDVSGEWTEVIIRDRRDIEVPSGGDWDISRWDMNSQELLSYFGSNGGTVQITSASDSQLEGTFSFGTALGGATVEGSFTAQRTDDANRVVCAPDCEDS